MFVGSFFSHRIFAQSVFSEQFLILAAELEGVGILKQSSEWLVFSPPAWLTLLLLALEVLAGFGLFASLKLHHQLLLVPVNFSNNIHFSLLCFMMAESFFLYNFSYLISLLGSLGVFFFNFLQP